MVVDDVMLVAGEAWDGAATAVDRLDAETDHDPGVAISPPRVLVVDDDAKLADILYRSLNRAGFTCIVAESGDQALWAVGARQPDAIVLDVMIPHPSGIEVCRHLRAAGYDRPIVMISARSSPDDRAAAVRAGADDFLAKPFALHDLEASLEVALAGRTTPRGRSTTPDPRRPAAPTP